jgi:hypothetical protein
LGSKSQVTLYKGHLGVGVTEPSGQLELAGDERIQSIPPRGLERTPIEVASGMTADEFVEGHGVFTVSASGGQLPDYNGAQLVFRRHSPFTAVAGDLNYWSRVGVYNSSGTYTGTVKTSMKDGGTLNGEWIQLSSPYGYYLKKTVLYHRFYNSQNDWPRGRMPKDFTFVGSNNGSSWSVIKSFGNISYEAATGKQLEIDSKNVYKDVRLIVHSIVAVNPDGVTGNETTLDIGQWHLFGTPGPTTLDKGSLTLGRSLDVPRISRYDVDTETPRPEKLVVDFDTTVNSSPTDISGQGNHGRFVNGASYSAADKAFEFVPGTNGTNNGDHIQVTLNNTAGAWAHSLSVWVKLDDANADGQALMGIGETTGRKNSVLYIYAGSSASTKELQYSNHNSDSLCIPNGTVNFVVGRWYHIVLTTNAGTMSSSNQKMYVDGIEQPTTIIGTASNLTLNLYANDNLFIGRQSENYFGNWFDGQMSNYKIYSVVLEPSEVKKLYNLGRTGRSMVISDTAVGIGKVPEAQLDVRGTIGIDNILWSGGNWTHPLLPEAEFYWNPQSYISKPFSNATTAGSTVTDMNGKMNGIQGNAGWYNNWWQMNSTASYIETVSNMDLQRNWTIIVWNKSNFNDRRLAGHGQTNTNGGFHWTSNGNSLIRFGFHSNDVDSSEDFFTNSNTWCQFAATYYHANGATQNRQMYQNERLIMDMQAGLLAIGGGSGVQTVAYTGSPTPLRFGQMYGTGNYSNLNNRFGPIAFFGRVLSGSEIRSLYNYFRITWQSGGDDLA